MLDFIPQCKEHLMGRELDKYVRWKKDKEREQSLWDKEDKGYYGEPCCDIAHKCH